MHYELTDKKPSFGCLDDVKVVYAAVEEATPKAACIMAEWGADVTWIENTGAGDTVRDTKYLKEAERRNQRGMALNYFSDEGREVLLKMLEGADIFMEASKGGTYARHGLSDEVLLERNPRLVIVHISGFGQSGEPDMVKRAAYDLTVMAYSGLMSQNGTQDQPMNPGPYIGDYINSLMIIGSSLAALHKVEHTGKGEVIDLAMFETLMCIGEYYMVDYLNEGTIWPRPGARNQNLCGIGEYKCNDGFIGLCLYGVDQNRYLLETIGLGNLWGTKDIPEDTSGLWLSNPRAKEIEEHLEAYLATQSKFDVEADFSAHRIAAQVIKEYPDLVEEPHLQARDDWAQWETNEGKTFRGINVFPKFLGTPGRVWRAMPEQGQDSLSILEELGYSKEQRDQMLADGVIKATR